MALSPAVSPPWAIRHTPAALSCKPLGGNAPKKTERPTLILADGDDIIDYSITVRIRERTTASIDVKDVVPSEQNLGFLVQLEYGNRQMKNLVLVVSAVFLGMAFSNLGFGQTASTIYSSGRSI